VDLLGDGLFIFPDVLQEKEGGWTFEGDGLQTCTVAGEVLVVSCQVIDNHIAVGTVNLMWNDPSSEWFYHILPSKKTLKYKDINYQELVNEQAGIN
jgi:hypothetical protein